MFTIQLAPGSRTVPANGAPTQTGASGEIDVHDGNWTRPA